MRCIKRGSVMHGESGATTTVAPDVVMHSASEQHGGAMDHAVSIGSPGWSMHSPSRGPATIVRGVEIHVALGGAGYTLCNRPAPRFEKKLVGAFSVHRWTTKVSLCCRPYQSKITEVFVDHLDLTQNISNHTLVARKSQPKPVLKDISAAIWAVPYRVGVPPGAASGGDRRGKGAGHVSRPTAGHDQGGTAACPGTARPRPDGAGDRRRLGRQSADCPAIPGCGTRVVTARAIEPIQKARSDGASSTSAEDRKVLAPVFCSIATHAPIRRRGVLRELGRQLTSPPDRKCTYIYIRVVTAVGDASCAYNKVIAR